MATEERSLPRDAVVKVGAVVPEGKPCGEVSPRTCAFVIFGASGDLTRRKLVPALYRLSRTGLLTPGSLVIGASRTPLTDESFRASLESSMKEMGKPLDGPSWEEFARRVFYTRVDFGDPSTYSSIKKTLEEKGRDGSVIFYLATPPSAYTEVIESLAASNLARAGDSAVRVVIEKPFGRDLGSAQELNNAVHGRFSEEQVYRIDHYLGKETVQNILMLRFANAIFEPIWNRRYIDHVQITVAESYGIEKRAGYYEQAGVIRDMFQNHMLQVLSLVAMEPPSVFASELVRDERVKVLRALRPFNPESIGESLVIGQYVKGVVDDREVRGYLEEEGVAPGSRTPTYAAMKLYIDNWRWQGVPFYLRSGKRLKKRFSEVMIQFKPVPHRLFEETLEEDIGPNALIMRIQPDERVQLKFHTKMPGSKVCLRDVLMDFSYAEGYTGVVFDAYERVLLDCMLGDKMLFVRNDGMEISWSFLTPILRLVDEGGARGPKLRLYSSGTWGPAEADVMIQKDGRRWKNYE